MKRKIENSWGGGGVIHDPSGMEIPRGWRGLIGRTIRGRGMDIFWNHTLTLMTSQRVERMWIRMGGYRRFRGEWVKEAIQSSSSFLPFITNFFVCKCKNTNWLQCVFQGRNPILLLSIQSGVRFIEVFNNITYFSVRVCLIEVSAE